MSTEFERLLENALRPVEPPNTLAGRLEETFTAVSQAAANELSAWVDELEESELASLREPRNWVRPVVAGVAGGVATGALVVFEVRRRGKRSRSRLRSAASGLRPRV